MKVLLVQPKDIYVIYEISVSNIEHVLNFLDNVELDDQGNEDLKKAKEYVKGPFYQALDKIQKEVRDDS